MVKVIDDPVIWLYTYSYCYCGHIIIQLHLTKVVVNSIAVRFVRLIQYSSVREHQIHTPHQNAANGVMAGYTI